MMARLLGRRRQTRVEARLDALEAAISIKLQALLVTATQAIAETIRAELARERREAAAVSATPSRGDGRPARSLLDLDEDAARRAERLSLLARTPPVATPRRKTPS